MSRNRWHILTTDDALIVARHLPVRFDVMASTRLRATRRLRLAHQVRQDIWRGLQRLRGFAPVVRVSGGDGVLEVCAGGQVDGAFPKARSEAQIAEILNCPRNRARWQRWAS